MPNQPSPDNSAYSALANKFVPHPRFGVAMAAVKKAMSLHGTDDEPPCVQITGPPGVGKTTLRKKLAIDFPVETDGRCIEKPGCPGFIVDHVPLLQFEFPSQPTVISVSQHILKAYGDPNWYRGQRTNLLRRVDEAIAHAGTVALLGDEAQRMVDRFGVLVKDDLADFLKERHAGTGCIIVLLGLGRLRHLVEKDGQIERRWDGEIRLEPYRWVDGSGVPLLEEQADFIGVVGALQGASPLPFSPDLDVSGEDEIKVDAAALRFFYASQGVIGYLKKLHKMVLRIASDHPCGCRVIDMELLHAAYAAAFRHRQKGMANPFASDWSPFASDGSPRLPPLVEDDTLLLNPAPRKRTKKERNRELMRSLRKD